MASGVAAWQQQQRAGGRTFAGVGVGVGAWSVLMSWPMVPARASELRTD